MIPLLLRLRIVLTLLPLLSWLLGLVLMLPLVGMPFMCVSLAFTLLGRSGDKERALEFWSAALASHSAIRFSAKASTIDQKSTVLFSVDEAPKQQGSIFVHGKI